MTKEYNLTWEEANLAMERGAICESQSSEGIVFKFSKERYECKRKNSPWRFANMDSNVVYNAKWRIVALENTCSDYEGCYSSFAEVGNPEKPDETKEYNLTWEEANLAMERGAIISNGSEPHNNRYKYKLLKNTPELFLLTTLKGEEWVAVCFPSAYKLIQKWRIVELTDCEYEKIIGYDFDYSKCKVVSVFYSRCNKHQSHFILSTEKEHREIHKDECINIFTKKLKKDIQEKKMSKVEMQEGKFYKLIKSAMYSGDVLEGFVFKKVGPVIKVFDKNTKNWLTSIGHSINPNLNTWEEIEGWEEMKEVSFSQAVSGMIDGKCFKLNFDCSIPLKIMNGTFMGYYHYDNKNYSWENISIGLMEVKGKFIEVKDPEKKDINKIYNDLGLTIQEKVSFKQAVKGMKLGKFYKSGKLIIRIHNGFFYNYHNDDWHDYIIKPFIFSNKFIEVEDPAKTGKVIPFNPIGIYFNDTKEISVNSMSVGENYFSFENEKSMGIWKKALNTFMRLKSHPLAVSPVYKCEQYVISYSYHDEIYVDKDFYSTEMYTYISPSFNSIEDAKKAVSEIGEDNLRDMFLTFQGIYDE